MADKIYCIAGLGADRKIFAKLDIKGYELEFLEWTKPFTNESLQEYTYRLASIIDDDAPIILGVSFGGMVAIEIAKKIPVSKLILISSVKVTAELPLWMRVCGKLNLNKYLPSKSYHFGESIRNYRLGIATKEEKELVGAYRKNADLEQVKWSIHEILNWKNNWYPKTTVHIHGELDKIFPIKNIKPTHIIKGGTHMMILNKAQEISRIINDILSEQLFGKI